MLSSNASGIDFTAAQRKQQKKNCQLVGKEITNKWNSRIQTEKHGKNVVLDVIRLCQIALPAKDLNVLFAVAAPL